MESKNAKANTVPSENQLESSQYVTIKENGGKLKILFAGNSITRHAPAPEIGWHGDWGMAASSEENDYVHQFVKMFCEKYGAVDYCVAQCSKWESDYTNGREVLDRYYKKAKEFAADIVIIRLGENINREKNSKICCKPYYDEMIKYFRSNPDAKVIVTDNFWNIPVLDEIFKEVTAENGYTYCRLGDLELLENTMAINDFEHKGVAMHPNDFGMKCIAERIFEKTKEIL